MVATMQETRTTERTVHVGTGWANQNLVLTTLRGLWGADCMFSMAPVQEGPYAGVMSVIRITGTSAVDVYSAEWFLRGWLYGARIV